LHIAENIAYHITGVLMFYADQLLWRWAIPKICVYLCLLLYSNQENLMLANIHVLQYTYCRLKEPVR